MERKRKFAPVDSQTQDNLRPNAGFQQPKPTNQAETIRPYSPYRLVTNDGMALAIATQGSYNMKPLI